MMIKKNFEFPAEGWGTDRFLLKDIFEHNGADYWVEVISSKEPLMKGQNPIYATLAIYHAYSFYQIESTAVYHEVFKQQLEKKQMIEAIESVKKFPKTYLPNDEEKEN